jgi:hypothetical protein
VVTKRFDFSLLVYGIPPTLVFVSSCSPTVFGSNYRFVIFVLRLEKLLASIDLIPVYSVFHGTWLSVDVRTVFPLKFEITVGLSFAVIIDCIHMHRCGCACVH